MPKFGERKMERHNLARLAFAAWALDLRSEWMADLHKSGSEAIAVGRDDND